jgi:hypothetical protein
VLVVVPPALVILIGPVVAVAGTVRLRIPDPSTLKTAEVVSPAKATAVVPTKFPSRIVIVIPTFVLIYRKSKNQLLQCPGSV